MIMIMDMDLNFNRVWIVSACDVLTEKVSDVVFVM